MLITRLADKHRFDPVYTHILLVSYCF